MASEPPALELDGIEKSFGAVHANRGISIRFARGSIHGVVGENGAGKSTLMSIIYGLQRADAGTILVDGRPVVMERPSTAIAHGIAMVHQHFMLVDRFTVLENLLLGTESALRMDKALAQARRKLAELGETYGIRLPPDARIRDLSVGERQAVEILKALFRDARILILDEPTSVLTHEQAERLFAILRTLRDDGRTVIFVSHKLGEVMALTDRVTVLRQGRVVGETATADTDPDALATMIIGGTVDLGRIGGPAAPGDTLLSVHALRVRDRRGVRKVDGVDLAIRAGEIVAIAGVAGSGQSELLQAVAGILPTESGAILWRGRKIEPGHWEPGAVRKLGIAHVPDEPRRFGLVADFSVAENIILGYHAEPPFARYGLLEPEHILADCAAAIREFDIRPPFPEMRAGSISGGNQQKVILARELRRNPDLLLIGEPTHGVDIGAVAAIQARLATLRIRGKAIFLVTSDLDQIRALADRILVMSAGRIVGEIAPEAATDRRLGLMMGGVAGAA